MRRPFSRTSLLLLTILVILVATLAPAPGQRSIQGFDCLACGVNGFADLILNTMLFVPFGVALALYGASIRRSAALGALLSIFIEVAQLFIPGRDTSLSDVLGNTLGTAIGAALITSAPRWLAPPRSHTMWLSRGAALVAVAACISIGLLCSPIMPVSRYYGLWTPDLGQMLGYRGRLQTAMLGMLSIADGPLPDSRAVRELLIADSGYAIHIRGTAGPPPPRLAPLFAIFDDQNREIVMVAADRDDLAFRFRTRSKTWRLDRPDIRLVNGMHAVTNGAPLAVGVRRARGGYEIAVNGRRSGILGMTVGSGWSLLLYPDHVPPLVKSLLGAFWIGALYLPAGFWARSRTDGLVACAAVAAGLLGAPALTTLIATPLHQWAGALAGLLAGRMIHVVLSASRATAVASSAANARTHRSMRE